MDRHGSVRQNALDGKADDGKAPGCLRPRKPTSPFRYLNSSTDFTGLLQADAYAGFDKLYRSDRIQEVACGTHFRRKIFENHAASPTPLTSNLLDRIAALYRIDEEIRGQPPDQRRRHRQDRSRPKANELRSIIDDALRRLSPKSNMAKALSYGRKRWDALSGIELR